jgi:hypothetical protein
VVIEHGNEDRHPDDVEAVDDPPPLHLERNNLRPGSETSVRKQ